MLREKRWPIPQNTTRHHIYFCYCLCRNCFFSLYNCTTNLLLLNISGSGKTYLLFDPEKLTPQKPLFSPSTFLHINSFILIFINFLSYPFDLWLPPLSSILHLTSIHNSPWISPALPILSIPRPHPVFPLSLVCTFHCYSVHHQLQGRQSDRQTSSHTACMYVAICMQMPLCVCEWDCLLSKCLCVNAQVKWNLWSSSVFVWGYIVCECVGVVLNDRNKAIPLLSLESIRAPRPMPAVCAWVCPYVLDCLCVFSGECTLPLHR